MEITFTSPKDITIIAEMKRTVTKLTIIELTDNPDKKTVTAATREAGRITIWEGADYDAIGQWTDADVVSRIKAIYK